GGPTGARVLLADGAGTAKLWDATTGRCSCCEAHSLSRSHSYSAGCRISADQSADRCRRSPPWVKLRNTRTEHRSSAIPPKTDVRPDGPPGPGRANTLRTPQPVPRNAKQGTLPPAQQLAGSLNAGQVPSGGVARR